MVRDVLAQDTICAIGTPVGVGGIGIVRISGSDAVTIAEKIFRPASAKFPLESHRLYYGWIYDPRTGSPVDEVLLSIMRAPRSYTREDVVEINCHSGYAVLEEILELVISQGARLAAPGEFTYRAFLHGRIDLSQAEAVQEIVSSRSRASLELARQQLQGNTSFTVMKWIDTVTDVLAHLEVHLDFSEDVEDEQDDLSVEQFVLDTINGSLIKPIERAIKAFDSVRLIKEGVSLALVGKPNVGKSSLLNALLEKDRAIVTEYAGTTRDVIEDTFAIDGILVRIMDTSGILEKADVIESLGIERTIRAIEQAHIVLWLLDLSEPITSEDDRIFELIKDRRYMMILNKADLTPRWDEAYVKARYSSDVPVLRMSARRKQDVETLKNLIRDRFLKAALEEASDAFAINQRHREHLLRALESFKRAKALCEDAQQGHSPVFPYELVAYELEAARKELNAIVGREVSLDDVLDKVFSTFCIGK
jgi:tRNA modification GTPase